MTSNSNWSDRTDNHNEQSSTTEGLGASSPSRMTFGDEFIVENSDVFRETIRARNIYAAWARKLTTARPNDPDLQKYHEEIKKSGEIVSAFLTQLNVPLFKIPATEKELDLIVLRKRSKVVDPQPPSAEEAKKPAAVLPSPRKGRKAKRSVDADGAHAANWSRCPKHPTNAKKKGKNINSKRGTKPIQKSAPKQIPLAPRPDISKARKVTQNLNYASVVQNAIPQEHVSPPPTISAPPTPAPSKDASINAGLLKDLLVLIEDAQCVDKQVFCRAFKNSLPALRSASADVDKTYIIFEAYCRLRSSQP
ncbi:hypothetical protein TNIN_64161 [Trichonephila inaurata madagascariensis]|uniref:Uncharacterized protein n=1 Tax=Trichonephila inaurata madagascariensis TaxID=2747483 RepID=A0A8X6KHQ8_9ARAC|nr:hypothetical protein TNIN_64161 [Trichonephila inaurata madagascariensis]